MSRAARPLIGITASTREIVWDGWTMDVDMIPSPYHRVVRQCGGIPVLIPPGGDAADILDKIDGLIVSGGPDIAPETYGQEPSPHTTEYYPLQDKSEIELIRGAMERDMPALLICRGFQLFALMHGGEMAQHLPETPGFEKHGGHHGLTTEHEVNLTPGSQLAELLGERVTVNSTHHQGITEAGSLEVVGRGSEDGLVEAVAKVGLTYFIAVQWHPERIGHINLYQQLIEFAGTRN